MLGKRLIFAGYLIAVFMPAAVKSFAASQLDSVTILGGAADRAERFHQGALQEMSHG